MGVTDVFSNAGIGGMIISVWVDAFEKMLKGKCAAGPQTRYVVPL